MTGCQKKILQLNLDKIEVFIIGKKDQKEKLTPKLNILGLIPSQIQKNVVVFDFDFNFKAHVCNFTKC